MTTGLGGGTMIDELYVLLGARMDTKTVRAWERRLDATRRKMDAMGGSMMRWGAAGAAAVGVIGNSVYQFEKKINAVNSVLATATDEQKRRIRELARELGATTQFTAPQAAEAAFELAKAGFNPEEIIEALPNVLNLAAAGDLTMADAAKVAVSNLRGFGEEVTELTNIMDMLAVSAASANTDILQLGLGAIPKVAPLVRQLGGDIAPMMAMLARIQDAGIDPSIAGTQMRQIMLRLLGLAGFGEQAKKMMSPEEAESIELAPNKAKKTLAAMGVAPDELRAYMDKGDIVGALRLLIDRGMTKDTAFMQGLFETRSIATLGALTGSMYGDRSILSLIDNLENSGGAAQRMADTRMEGIVGEILRLISALGEVQLALGDAGVTATIDKFSKKVRELIEWFKSLDEGTQSVIAHTISLLPLLIGVGLAFKAIAFALGGLSFLIAAGPAVAGAIGFIIKAGALIIGLIQGIGTIFGILAAVFTLPAWGVVALISAALAALAAGIWYFWEEIVAIWNKVTSWLPDFITGEGDANTSTDPMANAMTGSGARIINDNKSVKIEVNPPPGANEAEIARLTLLEFQKNVLTTTAEDVDDGTIP